MMHLPYLPLIAQHALIPSPLTLKKTKYKVNVNISLTTKCTDILYILVMIFGTIVSAFTIAFFLLQLIHVYIIEDFIVSFAQYYFKIFTVNPIFAVLDFR